MLADKLVMIIEGRSQEIAGAWYSEVMESQYTPTMKRLSEEEGLNIALRVYGKLGQWLQAKTDDEIEKTYLRFGEQCYFRGFRMEEMVMLLVLIKRYLWLHLLAEGIMTTNIEVYQALDVNNKVVLYFDRAIYFSILGFKNARKKEQRA